MNSRKKLSKNLMFSQGFKKNSASFLAISLFKTFLFAIFLGRYLINIKFNKTHIAGSPFEIQVNEDEAPNESRILVNKDELKSGVVNQEIVSLIDTRQAGAGELTANCLGPSKSAFCKFIDQKDGTYLLKILPQEIGKHMLQIKYNDVNIPGSPFTIRISSPPDASRVDVFGPGICHGLLDNYESKFVCDTRGAGAGQLTVRIRGPKGAFKVDMQRKDEKDRSIICKYDPLEV
jgi:filamin